ncbi:MAG: glutamate racemase [Muribaculaceae bacterium]|nr:glutamate racemase [Muribaculaceae bacterium]
MTEAPIGIFDSGYGGLTILHDIELRLPQYDYIYLGDNARAPYGTRSFDVVYDFTLACVRQLFSCGCNLVVLACNTASAKALRTIQQNDLPRINTHKRVLGVIRPTVENIGLYSRTGHVGILATQGTVQSHSYCMEIAKLFPDMKVTEYSAPMWVPLVENGEADGPGADYFVKKYVDNLLKADPQIDLIVLGCTHYPLLYQKIRRYTPPHIRIMAQGDIVADSLALYLDRHPELEQYCSKGGITKFITSENPRKFETLASIFMGRTVKAEHVDICVCGS